MPDSYWCGQECFKQSWNFHKQFHSLYVPSKDDPNVYVDQRFVGFSYTGKLRKGKEGPRRNVPPEIPRPVYVKSACLLLV